MESRLFVMASAALVAFALAAVPNFATGTV